MTTNTAPTNYRRCPDGHKHEWTYRRDPQPARYICEHCDLRVTKAELKAHTDAD